MLKNLTFRQRDELNALLNFLESIVMKDSTIASKYETNKSECTGNLYLLAKLEDDYFDSYNYTIEDYRNALTEAKNDLGKSYLSELTEKSESKDVEMVLANMYRNLNYVTNVLGFSNEYLENLKDIIKVYKRNEFIYSMENLTLSIEESKNKLDSVESNDYYRCYMGLPPLSRDLSFNYDYLKNKLTNKELQEKYPNEKFLKYVNNPIDLYELRSANDFYILQYNEKYLKDKQIENFLNIYYENVKIFLCTVYNEVFLKQPFYKPFVRVFLLLTTLQKFISENLLNFNNIDFFNEDQLRNMFKSYGLDYFTELPVYYQRNILKNVNLLLKYKGTDKTLINILELFDLKNIEVYKYMLVKDYKRDEFGNPSCLDKAKYDENGKLLNPEEIFELKFLQVPIEDTNIKQSLFNSNNYLNYDEVVSTDPFWISNKEEILSKHFNYINTKYISIVSSIDIIRETMDVCYILHLIESLEEKLSISERKLLGFHNANLKTENEIITLFDAFVMVNWLLLMRGQITDGEGYTLSNNDATTTLSILEDTQYGDIPLVSNLFKSNVAMLYDDDELYDNNVGNIIKELPELVISLNNKVDQFYEDNGLTLGTNTVEELPDGTTKVYKHKTYRYDYELNSPSNDDITKMVEESYSNLPNYIKGRIIEKTNSLVKELVKDSNYTNLKNKKKSNELIIDEVDSIEDLMDSKNALITIFNNFEKYRKKIQTRMYQTKNITEYRALKLIYDAWMITDKQAACFNGKENISSYSAFLINHDSNFFSTVSKKLVTYKDETVEEVITRETINDILNTLLDAIKGYIQSEEFDSLFSLSFTGMSDSIRFYLEQAIDIFKAYSIDLRNMKMNYIFDDKVLTAAHLIDEVKKLSLSLPFRDNFTISVDKYPYNGIKDDYMKTNITKNNQKSKIGFEEQFYITIKY